MSKDSYLGEAGKPPSLHRYLYAYSNPVRFTDPTGFAVDEDGNEYDEWAFAETGEKQTTMDMDLTDEVSLPTRDAKKHVEKKKQDARREAASELTEEDSEGASDVEYETLCYGYEVGCIDVPKGSVPEAGTVLKQMWNNLALGFVMMAELAGKAEISRADRHSFQSVDSDDSLKDSISLSTALLEEAVAIDRPDDVKPKTWESAGYAAFAIELPVTLMIPGPDEVIVGFSALGRGSRAAGVAADAVSDVASVSARSADNVVEAVADAAGDGARYADDVVDVVGGGGNNVYHATTNPGAANGVLQGIDPQFLNPDSRFGRAFYIAEQPGTAIAELAHYGEKATHGYDLN